MWMVYRFIKGEKKKIDEFDEPRDCFGDTLYDKMVESGYIDDMNDYDVDGDEIYIAVMSKTNDLDDFGLEWED